MRFIIIISLFITQVFAQKNMSDINANSKLCISNFRTIYIGEINNKSISKYILDKPHFSTKNSSIRLTSKIESPYGFHFTYNQIYNEIDIYNAQIKVNTDKKGNIKSQFDNSYDIKNVSTKPYPSINKIYEFVPSITTAVLKFDSVYFFTNNKLIKAIKCIAEYDYTEAKEFVFSNNELLFSRHLSMNYNAPVDTIAGAYVFKPDPLTKANVNYGTPYVDNNDNDITVLNNQRDSVTLKLTYNNNLFTLENPYVKITEHSNPNTTPTTSSTNTFLFTRSQYQFEDVNAFYHITEYQYYLQSLGFNNLVNYQIHVDAHALNGQDNSNFYPLSNPPRLNFGEGGVDDAEDADVVLHEYTHAIQYSAAPNTNMGNERLALDEANGDYVASSYSKAINPFNWEKVFTWDGHNEYWAGRMTTSNKTYPNDLVSNLYIDAPIWSSTIMQINNDIGRLKTDKILFQSIYNYASNMSMADAAKLYLQADTLLYNGANYNPICNRFFNRGLINTCLVGQNEHNNPSIISIYPNPTKGEITINLGTNNNSCLIEIYTFTGKVIYKNNIVNDSRKLDLSHLNKGVFLVKLTSKNNVKIEKLIIN